MTQTETRQLGIEFERRIQLMDPQFEFVGKVDTDTIYSILNEYQIKYVKQAYAAQQQTQDNEKASATVSNVLKSLFKTERKPKKEVYNTDGYSTVFEIPGDYWLYERSKSICTKTYKNVDTPTMLLNVYSSEHDIDRALFDANNVGAIIRHPIVTVEKDCIKVHHDCYTEILQIYISYYKMPNKFDVINTPCELPYSCFDELVDGAIQLFMMTYKYGLGLAANDRKDSAIKKNLRKLTNDENEKNND